MNRIFLLLFFILIIIGFSGCINEIVPLETLNTSHGNASAYILEPFLNNSYLDDRFVETTTFYLTDNSTAKVVNIIDNQSILDIAPIQDFTKMDSDVISNIVVVAEYANNTNSSSALFENIAARKSGSNLSYIMSDETIKGQRHIYMNFSRPIRGYVAYTMLMPMGQNLFYIGDSPFVLRVVLPNGYTTGNIFIGRSRPEANKIYFDDKNRMNLVWYNLGNDKNTIITSLENITGTKLDKNTTNLKLISLRFYKDSASRNLFIAAIVLVSAALVIVADYFIKRKKLRKIRDDIEDNMESK